MSEDGTPNTVGGLDFADESYGTREQYNVMLRMVLLGLLEWMRQQATHCPPSPR